MLTPCCFQIAFNGVHFADFHHRMPLELVSHVGAEGDVHINTVSGVRTGYEPDNVVYNPVSEDEMRPPPF